MPPPKITIIGAGLSGLTLARSLLAHRIPHTIYDRTPSSVSRHNYALTLHRSSYIPLLKLLGVDEQTFRKRVEVDVNGVDSSIKSRRGQEGDEAFRAHRGRLEGWLKEGVDVKWGWKVERVEMNDGRNGSGKGTVVLHFENGEVVESEIVVGADGVHSSLRNSVLPPSPSSFSGVNMKILPYVVFNGKRRVKRDVFDRVYKSSFSGSSVVETKLENGVALHVSLNGELEDEGVSLSWVYSRPAHLKGEGDVLFKPDRPGSGASEIPEQFYNETASLSTSGHLKGVLEEVFDSEKIRKEDRVLSWLMRSLVIDLNELKECERNGVLFTGDAVHAEPIVGGNGANAAMQDGVELARRIAGRKEEKMWSEDQYKRWTKGVEESEKMIAMMHRKSKSVL